MKKNNDNPKKGPSKVFIRIIIYFASAVAIFYIVALGMLLYEKNLDKITASKTFQKVYSNLPAGDSEGNLPGASSTYLIGFDYSAYELMSTVVTAKIRYDKKIETTFSYPLSNGEFREVTKIFDMEDEQYNNIKNKVDLKKLYNLDPKEAKFEDVMDGGYSWLIIYGENDEALKNVGGFCPGNEYFREVRRTIFDNLPEEFKQAYKDYDDMYQFCQDLGSRCKYGVFLSEKVDVKDYDVLVVDAQNYTKEEITELEKKNRYVLSYINIGSLENFRPYYSEYEDLTLKEYENWEEEKWVDVTSKRWQEFILDELARDISDKGVDGFFVDNCDVYYQYQNKKTLEGVATIMKGLVDTGKPVIMNGGDTFLEAYCEKMGKWDDVITGINQETVISRIYWDTGEFGLNDDEEKEYFTEYAQKYSDKGAYIFLLEYVTDDEIAEKVKEYCEEKNFTYYISNSLELN